MIRGGTDQEDATTLKLGDGTQQMYLKERANIHAFFYFRIRKCPMSVHFRSKDSFRGSRRL